MKNHIGTCFARCTLPARALNTRRMLRATVLLQLQQLNIGITHFKQGDMPMEIPHGEHRFEGNGVVVKKKCLDSGIGNVSDCMQTSCEHLDLPQKSQASFNFNPV